MFHLIRVRFAHPPAGFPKECLRPLHRGRGYACGMAAGSCNTLCSHFEWSGFIRRVPKPWCFGWVVTQTDTRCCAAGQSAAVYAMHLPSHFTQQRALYFLKGATHEFTANI